MSAIRPIVGSMLETVLRHARSPCADTIVPRLSLSVVAVPSRGVSTVHTPVVCLILQGRKRVTIGDALLEYDSSRYFVAALDVPATGEVVTACPEHPYVALGLTLDRIALADMAATVANDTGHDAGQRASFAIDAVTPELLKAWAGLTELLDYPQDVAALAPAREREILYRLLRGPLGGHLSQMAREDSRLARIRRAIGWMRDHYDSVLRTATLAEIAGMSVASFHRHFRAATAMSPLQYQKKLRLEGARQLLASGMEVGGAAYTVGYESASQFSREYSRLFGVAPSRDGDRTH